MLLKVCFLMFWQELKRMYFGWLCICANMCIMNLYMCCLVFKNINGTKCRCRNFQQHKRFISWFIRLTPQTIYRLYKIRIWVQRNSIPSKYPQRKQIHKTETNKISGKKNPIYPHADLNQHFYHSDTIDTNWWYFSNSRNMFPNNLART